MSLPSRLLGANPSIQVSSLLSGSLSTPSAKLPFDESAYEFINGYFLAADTATLTFSSIPSTYKSLIIRSTGRTTGGQTDTYVRFNSDSSSIYADHLLTGNPPNVNAFDRTGTTSIRSCCLLAPASQPSSNYGMGYMVITDYASTSIFKAVKSYAGYAGSITGGEIQWFDGVYRSTSAINTILLTPGEGNFVAGSRFNLYGVK